MRSGKKYLIKVSGILAAALLAVTFAGCAARSAVNPENTTIGAQKTEENGAVDAAVNGEESAKVNAENDFSGLMPSAYAESEFDTSGKILFRTEYAVIDKEMESISYIIENLSGEDLEYGEEYVLEVKSGEQWYQVPFPENYGWNAVEYVLPADNMSGGILNLAWMDFTYADGDYRIVKKIGDYLVKAEFSMGESEITPETPFGYKELSALPEEYNLDNAIKDGVVVFGYQDSFNIERLKEFMVKAKLGLPAMVRIGFSTVEGDPIFYDLKRNVTNDGREWYTLYHDSRRDQFMREENRVITQENFSYLVTDGMDIYLSDYAGYADTKLFHETSRSIAASAYLNQPDLIKEIVKRWEELDSEELHAEVEVYRDVIASIEEMTANRLEWNVTRYKSVSPDGTYYVSLNEEQIKQDVEAENKEITFGFGTKGYGTSDYAITLKNMDFAKETAITGIERVFWKDDETATLVCTTGTKNVYCYIDFYPEEAAAGNHEAAFVAFEEWEYVNNSDRQ